MSEIDLEDYVRVSEVAASFSVDYKAVKDFYLRRKLWRHPYRIKKGNTNFIRNDVAGMYGEGRDKRKPAGYANIKQALDGLPVRGRYLLNKLTKQGLITPVRFRSNLYLSPEDVSYLRLHVKTLLPLAGWVSIREVARRAGVTPIAVRFWAGRDDVEMRKYLDTNAKQMALHLLERDAERYVNLDSPFTRRRPMKEAA